MLKIDNKALAEIQKLNNDVDWTMIANSFPVSLEKVCDALGIYVDLKEDMSGDVSGRIFRSPEGYQIDINKNQSSRRVRFTVAHEIGHFVKHKGYIDKHGEILERNTHGGYDATQIRREKEANQFAAELLMPESHFIKQYEELSKAGDTKSEEIISNLAEYFWVSQQAVSYRIITLGLDCA